ncbi:hypothetical protein ABN584_25850 [Gloeocapsa sp. BRSZ]
MNATGYSAIACTNCTNELDCGDSVSIFKVVNQACVKRSDRA